MITVGAINHGCPKNLIDMELMLGYVMKAGYTVTLEPTEADIVIINTCAFIADAQKESIQSILETIETGKPVIVTGCLPQKYKMELKQEIPEIFAFLGTSDIDKIGSVIKDFETGEIKTIYNVSENPVILYPENIERAQITVGSSSYIKIAEGCNYNCAYCVIPKLRGKYHSRSIDNIYKEAVSLAKKGVSEIILIAQDTSFYGVDKFGAPALASLLEKLNTIEELSWIRVLYTYPSMITDELIDAVKNLDKVVKYFDIPLQHSHPEILSKMNRPNIDGLELIKKIRKNINDVAIRTSLIVGFPTETQEHFDHLLNFVKEARFDRLGVFEFSKEEGTVAYNLKPQITSKIKKERKKIIMEAQSLISKEINQNFIGKTMPVLIEGVTQNGDAVGRTYRDAPDIDGLVYIKTQNLLTPGDIEQVKIVAADEYDLYGEI